MGLYRFDEGAGFFAGDSSGAPGGPSHGVLHFKGSPAGPLWSLQTPFVGTACGAAVYGLGLGGSYIGSLTTNSARHDPIPREQDSMNKTIGQPCAGKSHARLERAAWLLGTCFFNKVH